MPDQMPPRTGFVFDERFLNHDTGVKASVQMRGRTFEVSPVAHYSSLYITKRIKEFFDGSGLTAHMFPIPARAASEDELAMFHTREYIAGIRAYAAGGPASGPWGETDEDTVVSPGTFEAALYAAGGALNAVDAVVEGRVHNAYALLRPPCHHATRNQGLGFCIFNNTVLAALHARHKYGLERVMIVDWDVHHGNGTQDAFYEDGNVLFVSLHQENWYPKLSGELDQVGSGSGAGTTVNIPLPPGTGDRGYRAAFEQIVLPVGQQFRPQLLIITAGQDASWQDPIAQMMLTMDGYRDLSQMLVDFADQVCDGRLVMLQAGGYSAMYVPYCTLAAVEPLVGVDLGLIDPDVDTAEVERCKTVFSQDTQQALLAAQAWHQRWWNI
jgi:acetoin utilization deacetylase AcuC-like enzyme